jgi:hypothetical protein
MSWQLIVWNHPLPDCYGRYRFFKRLFLLQVVCPMIRPYPPAVPPGSVHLFLPVPEQFEGAGCFGINTDWWGNTNYVMFNLYESSSSLLENESDNESEVDEIHKMVDPKQCRDSYWYNEAWLTMRIYFFFFNFRTPECVWRTVTLYA